MLEGVKVKEFFETHPVAREIVESTEAQFECWRPELSHEDMYRLLTIEDIKFITFESWFGEPGIYAWYYPGGVPHYMKVADSIN